jgi:hypothetical protein
MSVPEKLAELRREELLPVIPAQQRQLIKLTVQVEA